MSGILQSAPPVAPGMEEHSLRPPGTTPIAPQTWLQRDDIQAERTAPGVRRAAPRPGALEMRA